MDAKAISQQETRELLEDLNAHGESGQVTFSQIAHSALTNPDFLNDEVWAIFLCLVDLNYLA